MATISAINGCAGLVEPVLEPHGVFAGVFFQGVGKGGYSFILISVKSLLLESICAYIFGLIFGWGVQGIFIGLIFGCFLGSLLGFIWTKIFLHRFKKKCT